MEKEDQCLEMAHSPSIEIEEIDPPSVFEMISPLSSKIQEVDPPPMPDMVPTLPSEIEETFFTPDSCRGGSDECIREPTIEIQEVDPLLMHDMVLTSPSDIKESFFTPDSFFGESDQHIREPAVEELFRDMEVPSWREQLTVRAFVISFILSCIFTFTSMKFNLSTGQLIPSLQALVGLLGYFGGKICTMMTEMVGLASRPFTRQENTIIQTCVVTSVGVAFTGGFGTYLFAMKEAFAPKAGEEPSSSNELNLSPRLIFSFIFFIGFIGLFPVLFFRKILIIDFKLSYTNGRTAAELINNFHTPQGVKLVKKQIIKFGNFFALSFFWSFYQWLFTGGKGCGFNNFPSFGLKAFAQKFYFNFSLSYIGAGMINEWTENYSLMVGAIFSWGLLWPLIAKKKGQWYDASLKENDLSGLQGYKVFISIAMALGDGVSNLCVIFYKIMRELYKKYHEKDSESILPSRASPGIPLYDDERRSQFFLKDPFSRWVAFSLYIAIAIVASCILPLAYKSMTWYFPLSLFAIGPLFAFCNAYGIGSGLSDLYGRLGIFVCAAWVGAKYGGIMVGLASCAIVAGIVSPSPDLMHDLKSGYMTLASPRAMFVSQAIGISMGCIISPCVFWIFSKTITDIGAIDSSYPVPNALVYKDMAVIGVQGFGTFPKHCLSFCYIAFVGAIGISAVREYGKSYNKNWANFIPLPIAMAITFYIGSYYAIAMSIGCLIVLTWSRINKVSADRYSRAVASGLICGDGVWTLPTTILAIVGVKPPMCLKVEPRHN